jgi:hypothetical protein
MRHPSSFHSFERKLQIRPRRSEDASTVFTGRTLSLGRPAAEDQGAVRTRLRTRRASMLRESEADMSRLLGERSAEAPMAAGAALPKKTR